MSIPIKETLSRGAREEMVIIVPTLTEGNQSNKCIVSTLILYRSVFFQTSE